MTNRIKAGGVAIFMNDTQIDRGQTLGVSSRLDSEDIREIGNLDVVEVVDNVPTVEVTLDTNQYGSAKTISKMANKNFDWGTVYVTYKDANTVTVSSGSYYINEVKYEKATSTDVTISAPTGASQKRIDVLALSTSGAAPILVAGTPSGTPLTPATPAGTLKIAEVERSSTSTSAAVAMSQYSVINRGDDRTVALKDFEFSKVDFIVPIKEQGDNTDLTYAISRTMWVENAYVNRYDATFSTNGLAAENFSLESDNKTWFLNSAATVWTDRFSAAGPTFTLTYAPTDRENGNKTIKVYTFESGAATPYTFLTEGTDYTVTGTTLSGSFSMTGKTLLARYATSACPASAQPFFKRTPSILDMHPVIAGGLRHGQVEVYLSDDSANHVLRLQSVNVSSTLSREPIYEIGHKRAYDRTLTFPIPITVSVEALASDLREYARLCGKTFATASEIKLEDFLKNLSLVVKIYREDDVVRSTSPTIQSKALKTITVTGLVLTDENMEVRTEGNATQTFNFKANTQLSVTASI